MIAAVAGKVLGGGLEFALHCSRVVAHAESYMGLVEVGVGVIPGGGGVKEYLYRCMEKVEPFSFPDLNPWFRRCGRPLPPPQCPKTPLTHDICVSCGTPTAS
ncbi:MAG: enoyl-CoA hydratase/isomerase family protein [Oscillospiraceae bacterium]